MFANKQDLPAAAPATNVAQLLGLETPIVPCPTKIFHSTAKFDETKRGTKPDRAIQDGLSWLLARVGENYDATNARIQRDKAERQAKSKKDFDAMKARVVEDKKQEALADAAKQEAKQASG